MLLIIFEHLNSLVSNLETKQSQPLDDIGKSVRDELRQSVRGCAHYGSQPEDETAEFEVLGEEVLGESLQESREEGHGRVGVLDQLQGQRGVVPETHGESLEYHRLKTLRVFQGELGKADLD
jgi:hypothetical protein